MALRRPDPRFYLVLAAFWICYAVYMSRIFDSSAPITTPRWIAMGAAVITAGLFYARYVVVRRRISESEQMRELEQHESVDTPT